jgi:preprotein translocase SecE subunit
MAKTRAQRKAERRAREAEEQKRSGDGKGGDSESRAQHDTQVGVSGDIAEIEAIEAGIGAGAPEADLETPDAPKPSRARKRAEAKQAKEAERRKRAEQKRQEREQLARRQKQAQVEKRQRGGVIGFLVSCWAELRKVQWPDRETLVQATAVTIIFVAVAGAYLGALDSAFSFLIKQIL